MNKFLNYNLIILVIVFVIFFILLSLINSRLLSFLWIDFEIFVSWNYEFTKSMFFNIFSWIIIIYYFIKNFYKKIIIPNYIFFIFWLFFISIISSDFLLTNIFWSNLKWHWLILYLNLTLIYIILINQEKQKLEKIIKYSILFSIIPLIFAIKEYFFSTFDYWNLSNRSLGSFWHPNYLAFFILMLIPYTLDKIKNKYFLFIFILLSFVLFLTKSLFAIIIFIFYIIFYFLNYKKIKKINIIFILLLLVSLVTFIIYKFWFITKLNSFISRFYIWETTLKIIFSDWKYIIFWVWNDSMHYLFEQFKSPFLYIYENFWYNADRSHNLILQVFYNFWLIWLAFLSYFIYFLSKNIKNNLYFHTILIFLLFSLLNFWSIINYLFIIFFIVFIVNNTKKAKKYIFLKILFILFVFFSIFSSFSYYKEENQKFRDKSYISKNFIYKNLLNENKEYKILKEKIEIKEKCEKLINNNPSVENYFFCWDLLWNKDENLSKKYYKSWLNKLPDMWNYKSNYYNYFWVKNIFNYNRFSSEKYSNINKILERVN